VLIIECSVYNYFLYVSGLIKICPEQTRTLNFDETEMQLFSAFGKQKPLLAGWMTLHHLLHQKTSSNMTETGFICEFGRLCVASNAEVHCSTCGVNLCTACSNAIHSIHTYKEHSLVDLVPLDLEFPSPSNCQVPFCGKPAAWSCSQCNGSAAAGHSFTCAEHDSAVHVFNSHHRRFQGEQTLDLLERPGSHR
jgi:hypothetical protein